MSLKKDVALLTCLAKAHKAAERKKAEECIENTNMLYVTIGVLSVAGLVYNFFVKKKNHNN